MTQSFFQPQYQGAVQAQGFQQQQVPDISGQLRQQLQTEQQNYSNLAEAFARMPKDKGLTALAEFSNTLSNALTTFAKARNEKQKAEGVAQFYEDQAAQQQALEQHAREAAPVKEFDNAVHAEAAEAISQGVPFEVADQLKKLSGWKKYGYAQAAALAAGNGYKSWMMNQLQSNTGTVVLNPGTITERTVAINSQQLTVAESAAVRAHLRNQYLQESGLADLSAGLQAQAFQLMQAADVELHGLARKNYAIRKSGEDRQAYFGEYDTTKDLGSLITKLSTLVDENGKPLGTRGAWKEVEDFLTDRALEGYDVNWKEIYAQTVPWDSKGRTFGELYGKPGQRLSEVKLAIQKAKIAQWKTEQAQEAIEKDDLEDAYVNDLLGREEGFTQADVDALQKDLVKRGLGKSRRLDELAATLSLDAEQVEAIDKNADQLYRLGMLTTEYTRTMPPALFQKWNSLAAAQEQAMAIPESKTHLKGIQQHVVDTAGKGPFKNLGGHATLIAAELQGKYRRIVAEQLAAASAQNQVVDPVKVHNAAYKIVLDEYDAGTQQRFSRYFDPRRGFPNYMDKAGADIRSANEFLKNVDNSVKNAGGIVNAITQKNLILSEERLDQIERDYGTATFSFPPEAQYFANKYDIKPLQLVNAQLEASGRDPLVMPSKMDEFMANTHANESLINRYPTTNRAARYVGGPQIWSNPNSRRPTMVDTPDTGKGFTMEGLNDEQGRPVVLSKACIVGLDRVIQASGGIVKSSDITSSQRSEKKNIEVGGVSGSMHLKGMAIDIHGPSRDWLLANDPQGIKYGFKLIDYEGSHGGHFLCVRR